MGDDSEMAGVARAGDLNRRRTGLGATPKRCGIMQRAVQEFYEVAVRYYPLGAGDMHAEESGGIDKEDIEVVDDFEVDEMADTPAHSLANERGFGSMRCLLTRSMRTRAGLMQAILLTRECELTLEKNDLPN